jgi:Winged helix domain
MTAAKRLKLSARLPNDSIIEAKGREAETLLALMHAGGRGVTPLDAHRSGPAYRLAAYVHDLKRLGIPIEMEREPHPGGCSVFRSRSAVTAGTSFAQIPIAAAGCFISRLAQSASVRVGASAADCSTDLSSWPLSSVSAWRSAGGQECPPKGTTRMARGIRRLGFPAKAQMDALEDIQSTGREGAGL